MVVVSGVSGGTASSRSKKRFAKPQVDSKGPNTENQRVDKPAAKGESASNDDQLVDQTKQQIRQLVSEISELAKTDCSVQDFYQGFSDPHHRSSRL